MRSVRQEVVCGVWSETVVAQPEAPVKTGIGIGFGTATSESIARGTLPAAGSVVQTGFEPTFRVVAAAG